MNSGLVVNFSVAANSPWWERVIRFVALRVVQWLFRRDAIRFEITLPVGVALVRMGLPDPAGIEPDLAPGIDGKDLPS
jgi:hypothetical protein